MAWTLPRAGELRDRVRFERQGPQVNVGGVIQADWAPVGGDASSATRWTKIGPTKGGEATVAGRLQGSAAYDIWVRFDSFTSTLIVTDRAVNARTGEVYAIGWIDDPDRRRRWLLIQATSAGRGSA